MVAVHIPGPAGVNQIPVGQDIARRQPASSQDFGASVAAAGEQAGQELTNFGATVGAIGARLQRERQDGEDAVYASSYLLKKQPAAHQAVYDAQAKYPDGGPEFARDIQERLTQADTTAHAELAKEGIRASPALMRRLQTQHGSDTTHYLVEGVTMAHNAVVSRQQTALDQNANTLASRVQAGQLDIPGANQVIDQMAIGSRSLYTPAQHAKKVQDWKEAAMDAAISGAIQANDFGKAERLRREFYGDVKAGEGTAADLTMRLLRQSEGFKPGTYADNTIRGGRWVNSGYRLGYGSDTITAPDGTARPVRQGDTVSRLDAERDLARRSTETLSDMQLAIGPQAFAKLTPSQQAALASVAYNYGELPARVVSAAKTADAQTISASIEALRTDNGGINAGRRSQEAAIVRGATIDPAFADADKAVKWANAIETGGRAAIIDQERAARLADHEAKRVSEQREGDILKDIYSDKPTISVKDIVNDPALTRDSKERMIGIVQRAEKGEPMARVSQQTTMAILDSMRKPEGDPGRMMETKPIYDAFIAGNLTRADFEFLRKQFAEGAGSDGGNLIKLKTAFLISAKEALDLGNMASKMTGGTGTFARYDFERHIDSQVEAYRKAGKDPLALFDPASKDYLGKLDETGRVKVLRPFMRDLQQETHQAAETVAPAVPAKSVADLDAWVRARGIVPMAAPP